MIWLLSLILGTLLFFWITQRFIFIGTCQGMISVWTFCVFGAFCLLSVFAETGLFVLNSTVSLLFGIFKMVTVVAVVLIIVLIIVFIIQLLSDKNQIDLEHAFSKPPLSSHPQRPENAGHYMVILTGWRADNPRLLTALHAIVGREYEDSLLIDAINDAPTVVVLNVSQQYAEQCVEVLSQSSGIAQVVATPQD